MASLARSSLLRQAVARASPCTARSVTTRNAFAQPASASRSRISQVAAFHISSRRSGLLPSPPQRITGGVNDPAPVPHPNAAHGSYHWAFERLLAASLVPLTIAPFASGSLNPATDAVLCGVLLLHSHLGFQSCIIDYVSKSDYPRLHKTAWWLLNGATVLVAVGLYEFETNDVGVTEAIKRVWTA